MRSTAIRSQPDDRFEAIFEIPDSHRLVQVRSKTRGGIMSANYWRHDEYGSDGKLAARYESFEERSAESGATTSGWHNTTRAASCSTSAKASRSDSPPDGVLLKLPAGGWAALQASPFLVRSD